MSAIAAVDLAETVVDTGIRPDCPARNGAIGGAPQTYPGETMYTDQRFAAFLFDMDGTLLNSIASAERVWSRWAARHGLDVATFLPTIHGVRSVETIRRLNLSGVDPEAEARAITQAEIEDTDGIVPIAHAPDFLAALPPD